MNKLFYLLILCLWGMAGNASPKMLNMIDFGAKGDGTSNDYPALCNALRALHEARGGELFFPAGSYRIATRARAAILLERLSNATIRFAPGAELLMDNLLADGAGGGHGVVVRGPASNIRLEHVRVRWREKASRRSSGDAFRFEGFPADSETISRIFMNDCSGENSPQTGAVFMGCSDIFVRNFMPVNTWADGLHFNACRRVNVNGVLGLNNGDDTLAFVTYYSEKNAGTRGTVFSFPALCEWSNSDSNAVNIISTGGHADGMRISGGQGINVSNLTVSGKWCGVQLDAARKTTPNRAVGWGYPASRNINLSNIAIRNCKMGLIVRTLNIPAGASPADWKFGVTISNVSICNASELGVDIQGVGGVMLNQVRCDSTVRLRNLRGAISIAGFCQQQKDFQIIGVQGKEDFGYYRNMESRETEIEDPTRLGDGNISISGLFLDNAHLKVSRFSGLTIRNSRLTGKAEIANSRDIIVQNTQTALPPQVEKSIHIQWEPKK